MRKYPCGENHVEAVYDNTPADNPFLAAMPEMMSRENVNAELRSLPPLPYNLSQMTLEERRRLLPMLASIFVPMAYMFNIYDLLYRAIATTYTTMSSIESIRQTNALFNGRGLASYATQADTGSILGVPGIGKTSTVRRCLALMPQVIEHSEYREQPFYCKQVLYLVVECPSDCSIKTLVFSLVAALDRAIGSDYLHRLTALRSVAVSSLAAQIKILCMTHHVGLIVVDEIQNAVQTARRNNQVKPLIKFLVELTNDTSTAVYFVGTPTAEELFTSEEHLRRRTRGIRLLPLKPDGTYREFLTKLWPYQLTPQQVPLAENLANKLYDFSGGIPAYIIQIFRESQAQALISERAHIDEKIMQKAISILAIKVPKVYSGGTYISDFEDQASDDTPPVLPKATEGEVKRQYANKRGRKSVRRDESDLLAAYRTQKDLLAYLRGTELMERMEPC